AGPEAEAVVVLGRQHQGAGAGGTAARAHWRASSPAGLKTAGSSRPSPHSRSVKVLTPKWRNSASSSRCQASWAGEGRGRVGGRGASQAAGRAKLPASAQAAAVKSRREILMWAYLRRVGAAGRQRLRSPMDRRPPSPT